MLHTRFNRAFRSVFRFVSDNFSDNFCILCAQTAFFIRKQKALGDFQIFFQTICASFVPDLIVISNNVYPILSSLHVTFSCLCCYPAEDQLASLYLVPSRKRCVATYVRRFALCSCSLNRSLNLSSCCICISLAAPSCKYTCRAHFLLSMLSTASSGGTRVPHSTTTTLLNSEGARVQHRCNTRLGGWTQINIKERNRVLLCAS